MNKSEQGIGQNPESRLVRYPDLRTISETKIQPRERINVLVAANEKSFPQIKNLADFIETGDSARSRAAIAGLEVHAKHGLRKALVDGQFGNNGRVIKPFNLSVEAINHGEMPLIIPEGFSLFNFFKMPPESIISGDNLIRLFMKRGIEIEGQFGIDWGTDNDLAALYVRIKQGRYYIAPSDEPFVLQEGNDFRVRTKNRYQDIPPNNRKEVFSIGRTMKITINNKDTEMVLADQIFDGINGQPVEDQINSVLIQPTTDHEVWTESIDKNGSPERTDSPRFAKFVVVRNGIPQAA